MLDNIFFAESITSSELILFIQLISHIVSDCNPYSQLKEKKLLFWMYKSPAFWGTGNNFRIETNYIFTKRSGNMNRTGRIGQ